MNLSVFDVKLPPFMVFSIGFPPAIFSTSYLPAFASSLSALETKEPSG
jgi:hypothetical protein